MKRKILCLMSLLAVVLVLLALTACDNKKDEPPKHTCTFTNYVSNGDATCTEDGTKTAKCDRCDATDTVTDTGSALEGSKYSEGLAFTLNSDGQSYSVSGIGTCTDTDIIIPPTYNDKPVTSIGFAAFFVCTGLTSITIPNSVTSIGEDAFYNCTGLTSITIPSCVTMIGSGAFFGTGLESITVDPENTVYHSDGNCLIETESKTLIAGCKNSIIPTDSSVTSIGDYAFYRCAGLTSITIPNSVTSIGEDAFYNCTGLTNITIPNSVTSIGKYAFSGCSGLTSITIPNSVTSIGEDAFYNCTGLESITFEENSSLKSIRERAFSYCTGLASITIPNSVTSIGLWAFSYCTGLTSITIPSSVASISNMAFSSCSGLESITVESGNTVYHSNGNCLIETKSKTLTLGCKNSIIPTDGSVTSIGDSAFSYCSGLTSITIPSSVTSIGVGAFGGCTGLTSIDFDGTTYEWAAITKGANWNSYTGKYTVYCTDGSITKN